jgi:hypothetical protein
MEEKKTYRVIIDVYQDEDGNPIFAVKDYPKSHTIIVCPDAPDLETGLFLYEEDLDEYLTDHPEVEVVKDYRDKEE